MQGIGGNRDSGLIAGYRRLLDVRSAKNIYLRRSWIHDTVGHAPLAIHRLLDVRTTKWQKQLPTTMQCRSHSRRRISECLFVTACSMDEYAEENRQEFNCTSGISKAETTNNKRLSSAFCIEAIQTRSIARPLCDSRASCSQWTWEQKSQIRWHATHQSYSRLRYDCLVYSQKLTGSHVRSPLYVIIYRT